MDRDYDIFETVDSKPLWRCSVSGLEPAVAKAKELAKQSANEFTLMHLATQAVIAKLNSPERTARQTKQ
jgi:hypothetical protein